ncbi:MAG TPA: nuclear transport factor 2 family protein [Ginsengibacter sp.]
MKKIIFSILFTSFIYSYNVSAQNLSNSMKGTVAQQKAITAMLDSFNIAAANADYKSYFNFFTDYAVFTGTDATERWDKKEFMVWAKPYFDKKATWNFTALERHIYIEPPGTHAWFDELLNTQMKICRGSGVLVKQPDGWKLMQYILSATIPNAVMDSVVKIKAPIEDELIKKMSNK